MEALPLLGHVFGDPGKFIMECKRRYLPPILNLWLIYGADKDFLSCFEQVDRTRYQFSGDGSQQIVHSLQIGYLIPLGP